MSNPIVAFLQAHIGQEMSQSPSPVSRWLRGTLRDAQAGALRVDYTVREEMTNPMGIMHGGMIAAIIDDVIGATVYSVGNEFFYTTVNLAIDYLASARAGEVITANARVVRSGRNITHAECQITNADGKLLAKGASNLLVTSIRIPPLPGGQ